MLPFPKEKYCIISGGFDPIHSGHIAMVREAADIAPVIVILNSDEWLTRKKGKPFMPFAERYEIMMALHGVHQVVKANDANGTVAATLEQIRLELPDAELVFANGGDRHETTTPEDDICAALNIDCIYGIGGRLKKNSSSWVLQEWKAPKTDRRWGYYRVLHEVRNVVKVKELTVEPRQSLSMQRHTHRAEFWFVAEGNASVVFPEAVTGREVEAQLNTFDKWYVGQHAWHQLSNPYDKPCKIVEIQYGYKCVEDDIERKIDK